MHRIFFLVFHVANFSYFSRLLNFVPMKFYFVSFYLLIHFISAKVSIKIDFKNALESSKKLPRFWTNTGFAPPQPIEKVNDFFDSNDVNLNLEIIGSLPNNAIENVRIHWLLNLLSIG